MQQTNKNISMDWRAGSSKSGASANMTSIMWRRLSSVASRKHPLIQPSKLSQQILQNCLNISNDPEKHHFDCCIQNILANVYICSNFSTYDCSLYVCCQPRAEILKAMQILQNAR